jgi:hypothetical protein
MTTELRKLHIAELVKICFFVVTELQALFTSTAVLHLNVHMNDDDQCEASPQDRGHCVRSHCQQFVSLYRPVYVAVSRFGSRSLTCGRRVVVLPIVMVNVLNVLRLSLPKSSFFAFFTRLHTSDIELLVTKYAISHYPFSLTSNGI